MSEVTDSVRAEANFGDLFSGYDKLRAKQEDVAASTIRMVQTYVKLDGTTGEALSSITKVTSELDKGIKVVDTYANNMLGGMDRVASATRDTTASIVEQQKRLQEIQADKTKWFTESNRIKLVLGSQYASKTDVSPGERLKADTALARVLDLQQAHKATYAEVMGMWKSSELLPTQYSERLRPVVAAVIKFKQALAELGTTARETQTRLAEALKLQADAALRGQESWRQGATATKIYDTFNAAIPTGTAASTREMSMYRAAIDNVIKLAAQHKISADTIKRMWADIDAPIGKYRGRLSIVYNAVERLRLAHANLGATSRQVSLQMQQDRDREAAAIERAKKRAEEMHLSWQSMIRLVAVQLAHRAISSMIAGIREGAEAATELQIRISQIRTISQDAQLTTAQWGKGLRDISDAFGLPILDTAAATYQAISNQIVKGSESFAFMADAAKLAVTTVSTLQQSVDALSGIMNAYGNSAGDAEELSAKLFKTIEVGRFVLGDISDTLGSVTALGAQLGVTIDEILGMEATLTRSALPAKQAMTQIRGILSRMIQPTKEAKELLRELGVDTFQELITTGGGVTAVFREMAKKMEEGNTTAADFIPRIQGLSGILKFTSEKGFKEVTKDIALAGSSIKDFQTAFTYSMESSGKALQIEATKIKNYFLQDIGNSALKTLAVTNQAIGGFGQLTESFSKGLLFGVGGAILVTITRLDVLKKALAGSLTAHPALLALAAVTTLTTVIEQFYAYQLQKEEELRQKTRQRFEAYRKDLERLITDQATGLSKPVKDVLTYFSREVGKASKTLSDAIKDTDKNAKGLLDRLGPAFNIIAENIRKNIDNLNKALNEAVKTNEAIEKARKDATREVGERAFEGSLKDKSEKDQSQLYRERIQQLIKQSSEAKTFEDAKRIQDDVIKAAEAYQKLQEDSAKQNKTDLDKRHDLERQLAQEKFSYQKQNLALIRQEEAAKKKGDRARVSDLKNQRAELNNLHDAKVKDIQDEASKLQTRYVDERNLTKSINDLRTRFTKDNERFVTSDIAKQAGNISNAESAQKRFQDAQKRFEDTKISDIYKVEDETIEGRALTLEEKLKRVSEISTQRLQAISTLIESFGQAGIEGAEDEVKALREQLSREKKLIEDYKTLLVDKAVKTEAQTSIDRYTEAIKELVTEQKATAARLESAGKHLSDMRQQMEKYGAWRTQEEIVRGTDTATNPAYADEMDVVNQLQENINRHKEVFRNLLQLNVDQLQKIEELNKRQMELLRAKGLVAPPNEEGSTAAGEVADKFKTAAEIMEDVILKLNNLRNQVTPAARASGGPIYGTDSVPAVLSPGEFVVNSRAARRFYSQLVSMNNGTGRFANGGSVTTVGDININAQSSGSTQVDVLQLGKQLRREIRRGTLSLA